MSEPETPESPPPQGLDAIVPEPIPPGAAKDAAPGMEGQPFFLALLQAGVVFGIILATRRDSL